MTQAGRALLARMERGHLRLVQYGSRNHEYWMLWADQGPLEVTPRPLVHDLIRAGAVVPVNWFAHYTSPETEIVTWWPESAFDTTYGPWLLTQQEGI